ncbi:MAG: oligopeptide/dipeptide ABC transporter ATP-binding protein, partial [Bacillota bacterium]
GCRFHTRCPHTTDRCRQEEPELRKIADGHEVSCHLA